MSIPGIDVRVEIAFDSGYRTPDVDRTWTDVSDYVNAEKSIGINYGRSDEIAVADANQCTLTLDNTDARFTYGNAASPYYPNLKLDRPVRVTVIDGVDEYVRFTGYINEWPVEWPSGGDEVATATITASSRISRLGLDTPVVNVVDKLIVESEPLAYWRLDEPEGGPGRDFMGGPSNFNASGAGVFGHGPDGDTAGETWDGDGRPVVRLSDGGTDWRANGKIVVALTPALPLTAAGHFSFGMFIKFTTPYSGGGASLGLLEAYVAPDDLVSVYASRSGYSTDPLAQEGVQFLTYSLDQDSPTTWASTVRLNGAVIRTSSGADTPSTAITRMDFFRGVNSEVLLGRVAVWDRVLTEAETTAIALAGRTMYEGQTTDERMETLAGWAQIPTAELDATPSPVQVVGFDPEGGQILDLMRQAESAEAGVLYDNRDGTMVLRPRTARYGVTPSLTLDVAAQLIGVDYAPKVDRQGLTNIATGSGVVEATYTDEASREEYGDAGTSIQTSALSPDEPFQLAATRVILNSQPQPRAPSVSVDVLNLAVYGVLTEAMGLDIGSRVSVTNAPGQAPASSVDYFTEGYSETLGPFGWSMTLNLSPVPPQYDSLFTLDDAALGELDDDNLIAL